VATALDRYRRIRLLGEGGAGRVWLVEDRARDTERSALKELSESSRGRESGLRREFATLATLRHPNLVEVYDFDLSPETGLPRFGLEYVAGRPLPAVVEHGGPRLLLDLAAESLRALSFLHDFGLIHRDLKPENLLVRERPRQGARLVVLDFGLSLNREDSLPIHVAGTLPYMAPELFEAAKPSRRTDLYALGVVLHEAIHGRPPIGLDGSDVTAFLLALQNDERKQLPIPPGYPESLAEWLQQLLALDERDRPATASEALALLNSLCGTSYPLDTPTTRVARLASGEPPGREREIQGIWSLLTSPEAPRVVLIAGEAGSGKSRLLRWLAAEAVRRGWTVRTECSRWMRQGEFVTSSEAIESFQHETETKPTLVLLDEIESTDPTTVRFLDRAARDIDNQPFQVVAALRPREVHNQTVSELLRDVDLVPTLACVDLSPLSIESIRLIAE